jgi:transcriptional regulator with XRE-family HTH domain
MLAVMPRRQPTDKPPHPLRQWRDQQGLSQDQLAEMAETTQGMISHIERYFRVPRVDIIEKLLDCTGLPAEAFVLPERFLKEYPDFLRKYGRRPKGRGGSEPRQK